MTDDIAQDNIRVLPMMTFRVGLADGPSIVLEATVAENRNEAMRGGRTINLMLMPDVAGDLGRQLVAAAKEARKEPKR